MSQENVDIARRMLDASNRGDKAAYLALCDADISWTPPVDWPETDTVRGRENVWEFIIETNAPWEDGAYELVDVIDGGTDKVAGLLRRHVLGKTSGIDTEFEYWTVVTFRNRKALSLEWFRERIEALEAAGLRE